MIGITRWFLKNGVAANLLMVLALVAGAFALTSIRTEVFPRIAPKAITVTVIYPGASPEQVDRGVTRPILSALQGIPGIRRTTSRSSREMSNVTVERLAGHDLDRLATDVQRRLDGMTSLPERAERPMISRDEFEIQAVIVQVTGGETEAELQSAARLVEDALQAHPDITRIQAFGKRQPEIRIELKESIARAKNLSIEDVGRAIRSHSFEYPTGRLRSRDAWITLQADGMARTRDELAAIPVMAGPDGSRILLGDVAHAHESFGESLVHARFQGRPSVGLEIGTGHRDDLLRVSKAAREVVADVKGQVPEAIELDVWADSSPYIESRLSLLRKNAWQGLVLVAVVLLLFLSTRLALWVALGIPIALAATLGIMGDHALGYSLNDVTTFGLIIVLGILVDDAIVVGESVSRQRERGLPPEKAAVEGVRRVGLAVVFGGMTTVAAFFPLTLVEGDLGDIFGSFAIVVIAAILFSLLECFLILPTHLAHIRAVAGAARFWPARLLRGIQGLAQGLLGAVRDGVYRPTLRFALNHRYASLLLCAAILVVGGGIVLHGHVKLVFFPEVPGSVITVNLGMPAGTPEDLTAENIASIEAAAGRVNDRLVREHGLDAPPISKVMSVMVSNRAGLLYGELDPDALDRIGALTLVEEWRAESGDVEGAESLSFSGSYDTGGGFALDLVCSDDRAVRRAADRLAARLRSIDGVSDVRDDAEAGEPRYRFRLKEHATSLGLTAADLARHVGDAFGGLEVQRIQRGGEEVKVFGSLPLSERTALHELMTSVMVLPDGRSLPLLSIADIEEGFGPSTVNRRNEARAVRISAALDKRVVGGREVLEELRASVIPEVERDYPGLTVRPAGELEEFTVMRGSLIKVLILIVIAIYVLLAIPLRSYWQPVVVLVVVPFGFAGAAIGHLVMGLPLSVLSFFGMLAATGVLVNDSLVMISSFNQLREQGEPLAGALVKCGVSRFRAVVLTTLTTVAGLIPLMSETAEQAQYLIPAAVSLVFAELVATPAALYLVPLVLEVKEDLTRLGRVGWRSVFGSR